MGFIAFIIMKPYFGVFLGTSWKKLDKWDFPHWNEVFYRLLHSPRLDFVQKIRNTNELIVWKCASNVRKDKIHFIYRATPVNKKLFWFSLEFEFCKDQWKLIKLHILAILMSSRNSLASHQVSYSKTSRRK